MVTTKSGSEGKVQIIYSGYAGVQKATELPELVNSWEYAQLYNEATGNVVYTPGDIQKFKDGTDLDNYPNTDFIECRKPVYGFIGVSKPAGLIGTEQLFTV